MTTLFTYTSDFREELEAETASLLRSRVRVFLWSNLLLFLFSHYFLAAIDVISAVLSKNRTLPVREKLTDIVAAHFHAPANLYMVAGLTIVNLLIAIAFVNRSRERSHDSLSLIKQSQWAFFLMAGVDIGTSVVSDGIWFPLSIMVSHTWAVMLLPWAPRQALRPVVPSLGLYMAAIALGADWEVVVRIVVCVCSVVTLAPGYFLSRLKHSRRIDQFKLSFLQSRYGQMRRELTDARRIHESLFPKPQKRGPLSFDYKYEPMRQIGGDYLYARFTPTPTGDHHALSLLILDVTGHGIAAALTVNRLYGEVERQFAENPDTRPADVLRGLNRYVHLTLATHSVYATALCIRIDPNNHELQYASGGHPPAFLRAVDGSLEQLDSTSFVLGACADADYDPEPRTLHFGPGDALVAYTDGAIEARNDAGRMLGVVGVQRLLASIKSPVASSWCNAVANAVEGHRAGPPEDDTLVVEITRALKHEHDNPHRRHTSALSPALN